jgi:hypothetical protein
LAIILQFLVMYTLGSFLPFAAEVIEVRLGPEVTGLVNSTRGAYCGP